MTITTSLTDGLVHLYTDRPGLEQTTKPLPLRARFAPSGHWQVDKNGFADDGLMLIPDIETGGALVPTVDLRVRLRERARGRHHKASGSIHIDAGFRFTVVLFSSTLDLRLDGGTYALPAGKAQVAGEPLDAPTGRVALAGLGTFTGGQLHGVNCLVRLEGRFDPNPWAA